MVWLFLYTLPYLFNAQYYGLERGVLFYLIGAYIRTEVNLNDRRGYKPLLVIALVLSWLAYVPIGYMYYSGYGEIKIYDMLFDAVLYNGIVIPVCSTTLFLLCNLVDSFSNALINLIAKSTFGIYLLHDNMYRLYFWDNILRIPIKFQSPWFPIIALGTCLLVFSVCFAFDYMRERVFSLIQKITMSKSFSRINS